MPGADGAWSQLHNECKQAYHYALLYSTVALTTDRCCRPLTQYQQQQSLHETWPACNYQPPLYEYSHIDWWQYAVITFRKRAIRTLLSSANAALTHANIHEQPSLIYVKPATETQGSSKPNVNIAVANSPSCLWLVVDRKAVGYDWLLTKWLTADTLTLSAVLVQVCCCHLSNDNDKTTSLHSWHDLTALVTKTMADGLALWLWIFQVDGPLASRLASCDNKFLNAL